MLALVASVDDVAARFPGVDMSATPLPPMRAIEGQGGMTEQTGGYPPPPRGWRMLTPSYAIPWHRSRELDCRNHKERSRCPIKRAFGVR